MGRLSTLTKFGLGLFVHPVKIHVTFCPVPEKACPSDGMAPANQSALVHIAAPESALTHRPVGS